MKALSDAKKAADAGDFDKAVEESKKAEAAVEGGGVPGQRTKGRLEEDGDPLIGNLARLVDSSHGWTQPFEEPRHSLAYVLAIHVFLFERR